MELPGPNWDVSIYLYIHCIYFVSNEKKKIKRASCNTVAVQQPLTLGYMYSVYTSIKLGMFHRSFYNMKVNINFFSYILTVWKRFITVMYARKENLKINVLLPEPFPTLTICVVFHLDPWKLMRMRETWKELSVLRLVLLTHNITTAFSWSGCNQ